MGFLLPSELMSMVLEYIIDSQGNPRLSPYATINHYWQAIVEKRTFSVININTAKRLAEFRQLVWNYRTSFVRKINLLVELESYYGAARTRYETEEEMQRNNKIFTGAIRSLFNTLTTWPENEVGISLSIQAQSPGDTGATTDEACEERHQAYLNDDLLNKRFERSYLHFDESIGVKCAAVPIITTLTIGLCIRKIEPASSSLIASKLPRLYNLHLYLSDTCKWDPELRKRHRNSFAKSLHLWPSSVRELTVDFCHIPHSDENYPPTILTAEGNTDPLSLSLRDFSQQLIGMACTQCVVGKDLFWPLKDDNIQLPFWPRLKYLHLAYVPVTPSGKWLFEKEEPAGDEDDDYDSDDPSSIYDDMEEIDKYWIFPEDRKFKSIRTKFNHELLNEFYISAGKAALRMSKLKYMKLVTSNCEKHEFEYLVEGGVAKATWSNSCKRTSFQPWEQETRRAKAISAFQPNDQVLQLWNQVASEHTGGRLEVEIAPL